MLLYNLWNIIRITSNKLFSNMLIDLKSIRIYYLNENSFFCKHRLQFYIDKNVTFDINIYSNKLSEAPLYWTVLNDIVNNKKLNFLNN